MTWVPVCAVEELEVDRGACVLVGGRQVALFRTSPDDQIYGLANFDPFSDTYVISRGIVGSRNGAPKVASPMFKQSFDLRTGVCLDDPAVVIEVFEVRCRGGRVEVGCP